MNYAYGYWFFARSRRRRSFWTRGSGIIVDFKSALSGEGHASYPVVRFVSEDGRTIEFTNSVSYSGYALEQRVSVLYDRKDSEQAIIDDNPSMWGGSYIGFGAGTLFWLLAWIFW